MKIHAAILLTGGFASTGAFAPTGTNTATQPLRLRPGFETFIGKSHANAPLYRRDVSVGLFRNLLRKFKDGEDKEPDDGDNAVGETGKEDESSSSLKINAEAVSAGTDAEDKKSETDVEEKKEEKKETRRMLPFFAAAPVSSEESDSVKVDKTDASEVKSEEVSKEVEAPNMVLEIPEETETPLSKAEKLRAQAARIRLEAEKSQVVLTLEKIDKLNSKLDMIKKQDLVDTKDQKAVEEELQRLKSQLIRDEKGVVQSVKAPTSAETKPLVALPSVDKASETQAEDSIPLPSVNSTLSEEELEERVKQFEEAPEFLRILVSKTAGFGVDEKNPRLNAKDIVKKLYDDEVDYDSIFSKGAVQSDSDLEQARESLERAYEKSKSMDDVADGPVFSEEQIQAKVDELDTIPKFLKDMNLGQGLNDTDMAIMLLEEEYRENKRKEKGGGFFSLFGDKSDDKGKVGRDGDRMDKDGSGAFSRLFSNDDSLNGTSLGKPEADLSFMMESLYPKSTRKEDETPDERQVNAFLSDIVASTKAFSPSGKPISVPGGWIVRGKNECKSGEELINKLDMRIANDNRLHKKISFSILKDPFPNPEEQMLDPLNWPQVLFVAGPNLCREPEPILRTVISAVGIATAWYGSIYPFLANSKLLDRASEAMDLSDAGMPVDLSWLSEMSIPLFLSFMGIQAAHEIAQRAVAGSRNFEVTVPTIVPSILTGITNSITSLRTAPKNRQDLLDFAVAGPLTGMVCSIILLSYGVVLTASADAATYQSFPGLPLLLLRQSSLGGGIIDIFLGNGVLNVPMSAEGTQALATTLIPLHPFAVAGYFSLIVNALSMIPAGRTDGGRVSMAIFGRSGSQAVTFGSLLAMFTVGLTQSDMLLFYFSFIVFCQSELEVPCRNEVDDVGIPSVLLAGLSGFLMLLTLIPM